MNKEGYQIKSEETGYSMEKSAYLEEETGCNGMCILFEIEVAPK